MKKKLAVICALGLGLLSTVPTNADRYTRAHGDNPMRLVAYVLHPVGLAAEFVVMRPIHWVVSQPNLDIVFGHQPAVEQDGTYFEWRNGNFAPSIAQERNNRVQPMKPAAAKPAAAPAAKKEAPKAAAPKAAEGPKGADAAVREPGCCSDKK